MASNRRSRTPSPGIPDMPLDEKEAFYATLGELLASSDEDEDAFDSPRQQSRAFLAGAQAARRGRRAQPSATPTPQRPTARATPLAGATPAIVHATPSAEGQGNEAKPRGPQMSKSFVQDTPQGMRPAAIASLRRTQTVPGPTPSGHSLSASARQPPPSTTRGTSRGHRANKGKGKGQNIVPEDERLLHGLRFLYIPGERIKLRKNRMERAEAYGAVVTSDMADATHVVVDGNLTFDDIKSHLQTHSGQHEPTIATDQWPLECISRKVVFQPNRKFRPKGTPTGASVPPARNEPPTPQVRNASLEVKEPHNKRSRWDYLSQETTPSSAQNVHDTQSPPKPNEPNDHQALPVEDVSSPSQPPTGASVVRPSGSVLGDELAQMMHQVREDFKDLPPVGDEDANTLGEGERDKPGAGQSGSDTESERQKKRQKNRKTLEQYFACNSGGTMDGAQKKDNPNAETISVLQKMCDYYTQTNDQWRTTSYRKAIKILDKITDRKIATAEEAMELPCFGPSLSAKLEEIVNTRSLARLEYATSDPRSQVLSLFLGIHGVGKTTADKWIASGFRTLEDLVREATLTDNQRLGIDHYQDLNSRIPRTEVAQLGAVVKAEAAKIDPSVVLLVGGSYRRGAETSSDIDLIITKAGTTSSNDLVPFLDQLVGHLRRQGFLTAEVASSSHHKEGGRSMWQGCCVLPRLAGGVHEDDQPYRPVWRRIDLLLVPASEYGAALIYFTGNDLFNRSMRLLASKKGMRLNQRGLYKDVTRAAGRRSASTDGELVEGKDEKKIFAILNVQWREPRERWC